IAARYPVWYDPEPLACYRRHAAAATQSLMRSGKNIAEIRHSIELSKAYLAPEIAGSVSRRAREYYTWLAVQQAGLTLFFDFRSTIAQLREARKLTSTKMVLKKMAELALETFRHKVWYKSGICQRAARLCHWAT